MAKATSLSLSLQSSVHSPHHSLPAYTVFNLQSTVSSLQSSINSLQFAFVFRCASWIFVCFVARVFKKVSNHFFFFIKKNKQSYKIYITHTHTHTDKMKYFNMWVRYLNIYFLFYAFFVFFLVFFFKFFLLACFLPNFLCRVANAFYFLLTCFEYLWVLFFFSLLDYA